MKIENIHNLVKNQFPEWRDLEIKPILPLGTDNLMYRLGNDKIIRIPITKESILDIEKEINCLPKFSNLPITTPQIIAIGQEAKEQNSRWIICNWIKGDNFNKNNIQDQKQAAIDLANFINELQKIDITNAPESRRGKPLQNFDKKVRESIKSLDDCYDIKLLNNIWEKALDAEIWTKSPVWIHSDLHEGNVITHNGKISAIIDFGLAGIGDPACDIVPAWTLLQKEAQTTFRNHINADEETWKRGHGWALSFGVIAYSYYRKTKHPIAEISRKVIDEVIRK